MIKVAANTTAHEAKLIKNCFKLSKEQKMEEHCKNDAAKAQSSYSLQSALMLCLSCKKRDRNSSDKKHLKPQFSFLYVSVMILLLIKM